MLAKVILDVETGTDVAFALMVSALSPDIEPVGASTGNGNVHFAMVADGSTFVRMLLAILGRRS